MIKRLKISNLVLVDSCEIELSPNFNVLTGETGSGKSIFLSAIDLLLGGKADSDCIRHGEEKATIEAEITLPQNEEIRSLLQEFQIELTPNATLRRDIYKGKSKAFFNDEPIPLQIVKKIGEILIKCSDQHACLILKENESPRIFLDSFLNNSPLIEEFQSSFARFQEIEKAIQLIQKEEPLRETEIEHLQKEIKEFHETKILEVNDQELFTEFQKMESLEKSIELAHGLIQGLDEGKTPLSQLLYRAQKQAEDLTSLDSSNAEILSQIQTAFASIKEASFLLRKKTGSFSSPQTERERLEKLLHRIDKLKKRYGIDQALLQENYTSLQERLKVLLNRDMELETLQNELEIVSQELEKISFELHEKRKKGALKLSKELEKHIRELSMHNAFFEIKVSKSSRTKHGDDNVQFLLTPNTGEKQSEIKDSASGGELARLFLSLQTILVDRLETPTILFDEIDSSIGGVTAVNVGKKLQAMGQKRQVIAITHFPQVASYASAHFSLEKHVEKGRTITSIKRLIQDHEKEKELQRMMGTSQ